MPCFHHLKVIVTIYHLLVTLFTGLPGTRALPGMLRHLTISGSVRHSFWKLYSQKPKLPQQHFSSYAFHQHWAVSYYNSGSLGEHERGASSNWFLIWILHSQCIKEGQGEMNNLLFCTRWLWSLGPNVELLRVRNFSLESSGKCGFGTWHGAALVQITFVTPRLITTRTKWTKAALRLFRPCSKSPGPKLLSDPASK